MHARVPSKLNRSMQALSDCVGDCLQATPRPSHYQASFCESSPEASKAGGRGVVNHLERVKTVFDSHSFPFLVKHGTAATDAAGRLRLSVRSMPLNTSSAARRMPAGPFLQATVQPTPRLNCILPVLPCPEVFVSGAGTAGASWEKRLPQGPPSPEAVGRLEENAPLRKAHDSTVTILVRQEFSCELWPRPCQFSSHDSRLPCRELSVSHAADSMG